MKILFLGASNTDCGHCFTPDNLGDGYVKLTKEQLEASGIPAAAVNGGTDGFTFPRIYRKWLANWKDASFDAVCILGGINEVGALMDSGRTAAQRDAYLADAADALARLLDGILFRSMHIKSSEDSTALPSVQASAGPTARPFAQSSSSMVPFAQPPADSSAQSPAQSIGFSVEPSAQSAADSSTSSSAQASVQSPAQTSATTRSPLVLILEPFLFDTPAYLRTWMPCLADIRRAVRETAARAALRHPGCSVRVLCTQPALDEAVRQYGISAVTTDGIHLAPLGHTCLAKLIVRELSTASSYIS